jgi:hypothetical protein
MTGPLRIVGSKSGARDAPPGLGFDRWVGHSV